MTDKQREICEANGWSVYEYNGTIELSKYSPANEEHLLTLVDDETIAEQVMEAYENFDVDRHAEMWIPERGQGGVPETIKEIVEDAEAIKAMIKELADALKEKFR